MNMLNHDGRIPTNIVNVSHLSLRSVRKSCGCFCFVGSDRICLLIDDQVDRKIRKSTKLQGGKGKGS
jgi:hypothetical protein